MFDLFDPQLHWHEPLAPVTASSCAPYTFAEKKTTDDKRAESSAERAAPGTLATACKRQKRQKSTSMFFLCSLSLDENG